MKTSKRVSVKNISQFVCLSFVFLLLSCQYKSAVLIPQKKPDQVHIRDHYVVMILLDGSRPEEIEAGVAAGRLPTFKKLFFE
ncbi:MAG: hypothetical protein H7A32_05875, partial [Deltaproteobacteria bacterium]|nr:hypothetical protein [Deltaproteobacteria bacterium]